MSTITNRLSFIGKRPINFFKCDVKIDIFPLSFDTKYVKFGKLPFYSAIKVSGRFGSYDINLVDGLICQIAEGLSPSESKLNISIDKAKYESFSKYQRAFLKSMHGTTNSVLMRYIEGVAEGHQVTIQLVGVGYKASLENNTLNFRLGYSHPIIISIPSNVEAKIVSQNKILLTGPDYQQITQFAALIRSKRPPEPYNGKGVFVDNEQIQRKEGKKSK